MGLKRTIGLEKGDYHAVQLPSPVETPAGDVRGELLEVTPHPENDGPESMVKVYDGMFSPATKPTHAFEIWYTGGEVRFFLLSNDERSAGTLRDRITNNYPDSGVARVPDDRPGFPTIGEDDSVAAAYAQKEHPRYNHQYLPIRCAGGMDGWAPGHHPIAEIISAMQASPETEMVVQVAVTAVSDSWTNKRFPILDMSDQDAIEELKEFGEGDLKKFLTFQTRQSCFATNLRILAVSPHADEASDRVAAVAHSFNSEFGSDCGMGLSAYPVDSRLATRQRLMMRRFVERMRQRKHHTETDMILGDWELTALHIPSEVSNVSGVDWKQGRSGSEAPVDRPEHTTPTIDDLDSDSSPIIGGDR